MDCLYSISDITHICDVPKIRQSVHDFCLESLILFSYFLFYCYKNKHASRIHPYVGKIFLQVPLLQLTCGGPDSSDEDGGHGHNDAAESSQEGKDLGVGS